MSQELDVVVGGGWFRYVQRNGVQDLIYVGSGCISAFTNARCSLTRLDSIARSIRSGSTT